MGRVSVHKQPASCAGCFAWGVLSGRYCSSCSVFKHHYPEEGDCAGCGRVLTVKDGCCRLCWRQASLEVNAAGGHPRGAVSILGPGRRLGHHQLFFDRMKLRRAHSPVHDHGRRGRPPKPAPAPVVRPGGAGIQLRLFDARRDFARFDGRRDPDPTTPWLIWAHYLAHRRGEARGWTRRVRFAVGRGLVILLSGHVEGDTIRYSEMILGLRAADSPVERVSEVLDEMGVLVDDRRPAFNAWLERKLDGLAPGISGEVEAWARALHDGGPRSRARHQATVWNYLNAIRPTLLSWSEGHGHLREITRDDVVTVVGGLQGSRRSNTLGGLRSLFAFAKKNGTVFRNPTARIKVGEHRYTVIQPLSSGDLAEAIATATTPAARLVLALAAVHAARPGAIRTLRLDEIDLGNRRLVIAARVRPLDDLTRKALAFWLDYRRTRWPNTANPNLIINQQTAMEAGPISTFWAKEALRGQAATLEGLRVDRQLEEALTHGPDPLHLAAVFGLDHKTAIRYAASARQLLETAAERDGYRRSGSHVAPPR